MAAARADGPLRIHMVGERGVPATWGGVERHVEELGAGLAARGHDVTVWTRRSYGDRRRRHRGMRVRTLPDVEIPAVETLVASALATGGATAARPDVIHFHALGPGVFAPLGRLAGAAVVQTVHGFDQRRAKWGPVTGSMLRAGAWLSERVPDAVIGVSAEVADHYRRTAGTRPLTAHIVNGVVPPAPAPPALLERFGVEPGRYVLWVGRMVPEKAPDLLLRAFAQVRTSHRLVLAGGAAQADRYLAKVHRLAAGDDRVVLPGYVFGAELEALYAHAAAFVLPSSLEGLPLVLLEAASHGTPIIASDIAPHREVLGASAPGRHLTPTDDARSLAAVLADVLDHPELEHAGAGAFRTHILNHYAWDRVVADTEAVYRAALTGDPRRMPAVRRRSEAMA